MSNNRLTTVGCLPFTIMLLVSACGLSSQAQAQRTCPMEMYKRAGTSLVDARDKWLSLMTIKRLSVLAMTAPWARAIPMPL